MGKAVCGVVHFFKRIINYLLHFFYYNYYFSLDYPLYKVQIPSKSSVSTYQCLIPAHIRHPSKKKAIKVLQYVTKEHKTFISPLQQHMKITPNVLVDQRLEPTTNTNVTRIAYRVLK